MRNRLLMVGLSTALMLQVVNADCNFIYVNKSAHSVTLQGYFLEGGDVVNTTGWITIEPTRQVVQVRSGNKCNAIYKHSGQVATKIDLKNGSGYWIGNKGFLFAADRSYAHYSANRAAADDGANITLSNENKITAKEFKVFMCNANIDSNDCN